MSTGQPEQPWIPGPDDLPWTVTLLSPQGTRHLGFNDDDGRFYRLWQYHRPQVLTCDEAIGLRPSDIDQVIKVALIWVMKHPGNPRCGAMVDELAAGAKATVLYFAGVGR